MGILSSIGSIFGGNAAAGAIEKQQQANLQDISAEQARQEGVNQPFLSGGTRGFNTLADYTLTAPGTLDPVSQALEDQVARGITNRFAAMGLNDSGAHTAALAQALLPLRMNLRANRLNELTNLAGFGERGANRFNQIGQYATGNRINARNSIGEANAFANMNMWNQLGGIGDQFFNSSAFQDIGKSLLGMGGGGIAPAGQAMVGGKMVSAPAGGFM